MHRRLSLAAGPLFALCVLTASWPVRGEERAGEADVDLSLAVQEAGAMPRMRSLLVSSRGELILERYFNGAGPRRTTNVKSVSKSVISALVGIAISQGLIESVDAPIAPFFPGYFDGDVDPAKRTITIEDLLTMRSGLESTSGRGYGAWVQSGDWVRYVLSRPMEMQPGRRMEYSTGNTHLLSAVLTRVSGRSTWEFADNELAKPLGTRFERWERDPQGIYFGGNNMAMTPRQMVAFGELYLNRGRANGRQVVPESWIRTSWIPRGQSHWSEEYHGYGWWIGELAGHRTYFAWGYGGQLIFVIPDIRTVVVATSSTSTGRTRRSHRRALFDLVEKRVVDPLTATPSRGAARRGGG